MLKQSVDIVLDWQKVYETLGMSVEYDKKISHWTILAEKGLWIFPVLRGVTCNKVAAALKEAGSGFYCHYNDIDKEVFAQNDRDPNNDGSYIVSFRQNIEADDENKKLSADDLQKKSVRGITLPERLLLELGYFLTTKNHLDIKNVTLCAGSRSLNDDVPNVYWSSAGREVYVVFYGPSARGYDLRTRSVVFCQ